MTREPLEIVRRMWVLLREGGPDAALEVVAPDAVFVAADGQRFDGHDGIRAFFASFDARDERFIAAPFTFEPHGEGVLVAGHRRIADDEQTLLAEHLHFTYRTDGDGRIHDMRAFGDRDTAAAELARHRPPVR
ncbi:DUF4440 domain-containing protein [Conexibacter sp. W3-3-2]|uniref:SnoaL-like domain-containing protein n=1 Tax=Paraconexibacter algicola TaxID=2133960 RepID=A0A2T4UKA0_9ACTN|nr:MULTISPECIES: nuclear transport factor 2 family protein [Solirubrobacterales]MTD45985.1 DUF4440 domain-containing protein [Conexibacter sp. W3-3-2]PTL59645.1 hypothetical protein C7Y72_08280 [Paraconexibacter algicola]